MESRLNDAIATALRLDVLQKAVICKNIQLRDKTKIARTLVSLAFLTDDQKQHYDKTINRISTLSNDRNMVAHDMFDADPSGDGVEFFVTKAAGKLHFPETRWSVDETEEKSDELLLIADTLDHLKKAFGRSDIVKALLEQQKSPESAQPIGGLFQLGSSIPAPPQPPSDQGSAPQETKDAKPLETPQEPQE